MGGVDGGEEREDVFVTERGPDGGLSLETPLSTVLQNRGADDFYCSDRVGGREGFADGRSGTIAYDRTQSVAGNELALVVWEGRRVRREEGGEKVSSW